MLRQLRTVEFRHRRPDLPFPEASALPAAWLAGLNAAIRKAGGDQLSQVGRGPAPTSRAVAGQLMIVVKEGAECVESHGATMMRLHDRGVRLHIFALRADIRRGLAALGRGCMT